MFTYTLFILPYQWSHLTRICFRSCVLFSCAVSVISGYRSKKKVGAARRPLFPLKAVPEYTLPATVHYAAVFHEVAHQDIAKQFPGQGSVSTVPVTESSPPKIMEGSIKRNKIGRNNRKPTATSIFTMVFRFCQSAIAAAP